MSNVTSLRMRVLPRFPARISGANGLEVERDGADLIVQPDFGSLSEIFTVEYPDDTFFWTWNDQTDSYNRIVFQQLVDNVGGILIGPNLIGIAAISADADKVPYFIDNLGNASAFTMSSFVRGISGSATAADYRTALGLGGAATLDVGTTAGTVAAGNDSRITGAAQKSANLSDLANATTARTNLGLGSAATQPSSAFATSAQGTLADGSAQKAQNLNDLSDKASARLNVKVPTYAANRAAIKALDTGKDVVVDLQEAGREGLFSWVAGNLSSFVTLDTAEGLYVASTADPTGATGAWVRQRSSFKSDIRWFGGVAGGNCTTALQVMLAMRAFVTIYIPAHDTLDYQVTAALVYEGGNIVIEGDGASRSRLVWTADVTGLSLGQTTPIDKLRLKDVAFLTTQAAPSRTAVRATFSNTDYEMDCLIEGCQFSGKTFTTSWWGKGLDIKNPAISFIQKNFVVGRGSGTQLEIESQTEDGILLWSSQLSIIHHIRENTVLYYERGIYINTTGNPGTEGLRCIGNDTTHCVYGIICRSANVGGYYPVQNVFRDNSGEFFLRGIWLDGVKDFWVNDNWMIATPIGRPGGDPGADFAIVIEDCVRGYVHGNIIDDGSGTGHTSYTGVLIKDSVGVDVANNKGRTSNVMTVFSGTTGTSEERGTEQTGAGGVFSDISTSGTNNRSKAINVVTALYATSADLTTQIPDDDTRPQITEGTEILSVTITPKSTNSRILLRFAGWGTLSGLGTMVAGIWRVGQANALQAQGKVVGTGGYYEGMAMEYVDAPNTTGAVTYKVRVGPSSALTMRMNGTPTARRFGGAANASLIAQEINA